MLREEKNTESMDDSLTGSLDGKYVIFVRSSNNSRGVAYQTLRDLGVRIIMVHPIMNWAAPYPWRWIHCETNDIPVLIETVTATLATWPEVVVSGVLTFDEYGVLPAAMLGAALGLTVCPAPADVVRLTHIKSDFREWCGRVGVRAPVSYTLLTVACLEKTLPRIHSYPVVVKPSPGAGSMLVSMCRNEEELRAAVPIVFAALDRNPDAYLWCTLGTTFQVLIEEYIGGTEVDIDCIVQDGVLKYTLVSENFETLPPYFVESGGFAPLEEGRMKTALLALVEKYVSAHGKALNCVMHFEAKYDDVRQEAFVIEVNLRVGAAETHCLNLNAGGVDLCLEYVRLACGLPINLQKAAHTTCVASINFVPDHAGTVSTSHVLPEVTADASYVSHKLYWAIGDRVDVPPVSSKAMGWLVAKGNDRQSSVANMRRLAEGCVFQIAM